ncbi:hypothetical protein [Teredinibacter turnerae]|uniref:hypothetical protein n=1 Tax=Teredinibacter turnerae TaxID=2426 RepID=UPI0003A9421D|nr:hypothetical protein [Teredinibacter turnerae]
MQTSVKVDGLMVATVAALGGITFLWWNRAKIAEGLEVAADKVNPNSTNNAAYQAVNAIGDVFGDGEDNDNFSFGAWIYDVTHRSEDI